MTTGMFALQEGSGIIELRESPYASEDLLQSYLADHPALMPGDQINPSAPRRWLLVQRELGIPGEEDGTSRWSLDHLFLDQEAVPTLVEVKRSSDTRIRREVVGQMLDYAANAVAYLKVGDLQDAFATDCTRQGKDPDVVLREVLGIDLEIDAFWQRVKTNLQAGRIRLVFLADRIPMELRRIVEFLNEQMDPAEVIAVEIRQFEGPGLRTLVPRVYGVTAESESRKAASPRGARWDEERFFGALRSSRPEGVLVVKSLLAWAESHADRIDWGAGLSSGSFTPVILTPDAWYPLFSLYTNGTFEIPFQYLKTRPAFISETSRGELWARYQSVPGISLQKPSLDKRPWFNCMNLPPESITAIQETLVWCIERARSLAVGANQAIHPG